jgi:hypothetical protein
VSHTLAALTRLCRQWGAKDVQRVVASIRLAVEKGEDPEDVLRSVYKHQPQLFYGSKK